MTRSGTDARRVPIVFFGTEEFSLAALAALVENGYTVALVVTKPDAPSGRGMSVRAPSVKTYAVAHGITVCQPLKLDEITDAVRSLDDPVGVLSSFGRIVPESILSLFGRGIINIHPSLLPAYRGPSPIETAIMNGDRFTGVSLMRLVAVMDAGPVYAQEKLEIGETDTSETLYKLCAQKGSQLLIDRLPAILGGKLEPLSQHDEAASYTSLLNNKITHVDPGRMTALAISRHVRAYLKYPRTKMTVFDREIIVTKAHEGQPHGDELSIECDERTVLIIDRLIVPGKGEMAGTEYRHGYEKSV